MALTSRRANATREGGGGGGGLRGSMGGFGSRRGARIDELDGAMEEDEDAVGSPCSRWGADDDA